VRSYVRIVVRFLTKKEAARMLRVSERHLHALVARGQLSVVVAGRRRLFTVEALERFAREHERRGGSGQNDPPEAA